MKQIHDRIVFRPYRDRTRACSGQPHALVQKRCGLIKPRTCANEITQREAQLCEQCGHTPNYESHEAAITTGVIEANSSVI